MTIGAHVFGDNRLGCWVMPNASFHDKLVHRLPQFKALGITDLYLPREAAPEDFHVVKQSPDYFCHLWVVPGPDQGPLWFAKRTLADIDALKPGAVELNIEVADERLPDFIRESVLAIRKERKALRLRVNIAPYKAWALPVDLLTSDPQLYVIEQAYLGNMDYRLPEDYVMRDLLEAGVPAEKASVMYGAHVGTPRVAALPALGRWNRGSIYQDDLLANAGYIS